MDSRAGGQGNPYQRPYFGDPNMLRQQLNAYGMHGMAYGMSSQHIQQEPFANRRPPYEAQTPENHRPAALTSPISTMPQGMHPWMHHNTAQQQSALSPEFSMNMPNAFQARWEQEQASLLQQQYLQDSSRDAAQLLRERELHLQREEQVQRDREILLHRERLLQMEQQQREQEAIHLQQRERELQLQQEKEVQAKRERELQLQREKDAQLQREREAQMQREREAQIQREREAQMQREREAQLQREREAQLQRDREVQLQREKDAQLEREREYKAQMLRNAQLQREKKAMFLRDFQSHQMSHLQQQHQQQQQQQTDYFSPTHLSMSNVNLLQSDGQQQQQQQQHHQQQQQHQFNYFNPSFSSPSVNRSVVPSLTFSQQSKPNEELGVSKQSPSSQIHFPQSTSIVTAPQHSQWLSSVNTTSSATSLRKISGSFESRLINSIVSDKEFLSSHIDSESQFLKNWNDITEMDLNAMERPLFETKEKEAGTVLARSLEYPSSKIGDNIIGSANQNFEKNLYSDKQPVIPDHILSTVNSLQDVSYDLSKLPPSSTSVGVEQNQKKDNISISSATPMSSSTSTTLATQQNISESPGSTSVIFSQSNSLQVTQNSSVNINININVPSLPTLPLGLCTASSGKMQTSNVTSPKYSISEIQAMMSSKHDFKADNVFSVINTNLKDATISDEEKEKPKEMNISQSQQQQHVISSEETVVLDEGNALSLSRPKSKQSFSSIESFLGMGGSGSDSTTKVENIPSENVSSLESSTQQQSSASTQQQTSAEHQDRISVIRSLPSTQDKLPDSKDAIESDEDKNDSKTFNHQESTTTSQTDTKLTVTDSQVVSKNKSSVSSTIPSIKPSVSHPIHPSMRFKKQKQGTKTSSTKVTPKSTTSGRPMHPSMRLKSSSSSSSSSKTETTPVATEPAKNDSPVKPSDILSTSGKYRSEIKSPTAVLKSPISGGKPASYGISGGKPLSYSASIAGKSPGGKPVHGGKPTGGKPLSYLKSVMENSKLSSEKNGKTQLARKRGKKPKQGPVVSPKNVTDSEEKITEKKSPAVSKGPPKISPPKKVPESISTKKAKPTTQKPTQKNVKGITPDLKSKVPPKNQQAKSSKAPSLKSPPLKSPPSKSPPLKSQSLKSPPLKSAANQTVTPLIKEKTKSPAVSKKTTKAGRNKNSPSIEKTVKADTVKVETPPIQADNENSNSTELLGSSKEKKPVIIKSSKKVVKVTPIESQPKASPKVTSSNVPSIENQDTSESGLGNGKPFQFKGITFDAGKDDSSDSDSDSSSDSDSDSEDDNDDETQDSSSDESGSESDITEQDSASQTSSPSPKKTPRRGQKRKAVPDNSEVIASLKKRKIVNEDDIKIPLDSGWRRQTRLRPTTSGDGLRGDVYYFSPCGKKLRTYPELNSYIYRNDVKDVKLENFSFSTKLKVGEFLEAKQGSKFEKLTDEQVEERFTSMLERSRLSQERATEKKKKKLENQEKVRKAQEEKKQKKLEMIEKKRMKEEERRQALRAKAMEAKMKKEQEREAAKEAKRQKEEAIMLKKLQKKAALEASRIAKREKAQNILAEKQRIKEMKEQERLMKIEQQKMAKEMKQQAIENERERKRQQQVMSKVHEKEKRKRELVMMKAYEAQRRAEERERQKEQKRLEKTLIKQRKLEQKRYERLISKELKKPIDDMALKDLKPLPDLSVIENLNIPGKAYADLLMVQEFVQAFGHVLEIEQDDFPSLGELQAALLCESSNEDALFTACHTLLSYGLEDPGVSGKYATTVLGGNIQNLELNENNISEVLRLFILCRNEGRPHSLSDALLYHPLLALSPINKAAVLAFLCHELLCGKSIGREIDGSLESMSNLRRDKWNLEGDMRKLKAEIANKKPKQTSTPEKKPIKMEDGAKDTDDEKESDNEDGSQDVTAGPNDTLEDIDVDTVELENPTTLEQMEKKLKLMEKKHTRYRKKLFDSSHTVRGIHLGQDRFKRRYFILPNAGGIYVEGLESGAFDEEVCVKTKEEKKEQKEQLDTLLTSLKSPTLKSPSRELTSPGIASSSMLTTTSLATPQTVSSSMNKVTVIKNESSSSTVISPPTISTTHLDTSKENIHSPRGGSASPLSGVSPKSSISVNKSNMKWFSLKPKGRCEEMKVSSPPLVNIPIRKAPMIRPPNLKQLGDDRHFLESIYACYSNTGGSKLHQNSISPFPMGSSKIQGHSLLGLPPEIDINLLIQQDPQKAAELLEIQLVVPQDIPDVYRSGWWRITDPELMQKINKCAHPRGVRERQLQKAVARLQEYANASCSKTNNAFSLLLPDEENDTKEEEKLNAQQTSSRINDSWFPQLAYASDKSSLIEVEELEEKVFSASLQVKGWRLSQKISPTLHIDVTETYQPPEEEHPIHIASARLLALEAGIERRYMKPPFKSTEKVQVSKLDTSETKDENLKNSNVQSVTPQLLAWRKAVSESTSAAQLSMCVNMLFESIAWEKSIMKVFCILCRKSDNEERLLLCDACDRGCHTYCCKPKLEIIPEGDWFCQECVLMASGSDQCYACKGKSGKRLKCGFCPRHYHMHCLEPPLQKTPRSPWACPVCKKARSKSKPPPRKKPRADLLIRKEELSRTKITTNRTQTCKDMEPCRVMLSELEAHESSWPFLVPVNSKQFPEYYKIIKHPMDFHTMKIKLRDYQYKSRDEFSRDAMLVFFNCKTFNEDESEVGRAGETMRAFFEKRWSVIVANAKKKDEKCSSQDVKSAAEESSDDQDNDDGETSSSSEGICSESESSEVEEDSDNEASSEKP